MVRAIRTIGKKRSKKTSSSKTAKVKSKKAFRSYKEAMEYLFAQTDYEKQSNSSSRSTAEKHTTNVDQRAPITDNQTQIKYDRCPERSSHQ